MYFHLFFTNNAALANAESSTYKKEVIYDWQNNCANAYGSSFYIYGPASHTTVTERINDICYDVADTVSTQGVFSKEIYNYLGENLSLYGDYTITVVVKNKEIDGTTFLYGVEEALDVNLEIGDRVIIAVCGEKPSLFEKITAARSGRICCVRTAVVG